MIWQRYLEYIKSKYNNDCDIVAKKISFRDKRVSWKEWSIVIPFSNNSSYCNIFYEDLYIKLFLENYSLRPSCYQCRSKTVERRSDITLADFWNVDNSTLEMNDGKGVSSVWINSERAQLLWENIAENINSAAVPVEETIIRNKSAYKSVKKPRKRKYLFKKIDKFTFDKLVKKTTKISISERAMKKICWFIKQRFRK